MGQGRRSTGTALGARAHGHRGNRADGVPEMQIVVTPGSFSLEKGNN